MRWAITDYDEGLVEHLAREMLISPVVARLLVARGVTTRKEAEEFLNPSLDLLHNPFLLPDIKPAMERIRIAIEKGELIMIYGDYDVDGVTATALLVRALRALGGSVMYRLPHRKTEGYDIKPSVVDEAVETGVSLIITCDCGTTAIETAERAAEAGIDLIITDHHEPGPKLPRALAVINPKRSDSQYPFVELAGVGVAFKTMEALVRELGHNEKFFQRKFLDLVALGTVSDICPLIGENRAMVKFGMQSMANSKKAGIQAILRKCKLQGKDLLTYHLSYIIGPRLNAVGRLDKAEIALDMLLTTDEADADRLAEILEQKNTERQAEQSRVFEEAIAQITDTDLESRKVLVLSAPGWNAGVVGIVASKVVEQYGRPAVLLSLDPKTGACVGSARSIEKFNLIEALRSCGDLLRRCGGHAHAAGLSLNTENLDGLASRLNDLAGEILTPEDMIPTVVADAALEPEDLNSDLAREIAALEPFGHGNPEPVFVTSGLEILRKQRVGADGTHLKMRVRADGGEPTDCVGFRKGELDDAISVGGCLDICYNIRINRYNGYEQVQLVAMDLRESDVNSPC